MGSGAVAGTEITHRCDTEPGASGAPVFDANGRLIALHHLGFKRNDRCEPLDRVNKAVEIRHILNHVKMTAADIYEEIRSAID
jgi:V8-like Glu-specific endopeptidase